MTRRVGKRGMSIALTKEEQQTYWKAKKHDVERGPG